MGSGPPETSWRYSVINRLAAPTLLREFMVADDKVRTPIKHND
jgi:hypothetical protein